MEKLQKFEIRLCELINKKQKTNFIPADGERAKDIFIIHDLYAENRKQRFMGKVLNYDYKTLKQTAKLCIDSVINRKRNKELL